MIKAFFSSDEDPDITGIDWLEAAIDIANVIVARIMQEIESNGRLAESGKALVLKTGEAKRYVGSNPTSSAID